MRVYVRVAWSEKGMLAVLWWLLYASRLLLWNFRACSWSVIEKLIVFECHMLAGARRKRCFAPDDDAQGPDVAGAR